MNNHNTSNEPQPTEATTVPAPQAPSTYQAPAIESIVTADDLAREVLYAGGTPISATPPVDPGP